MGEFNAGKSSFVNALAGAEVAPVGVTPTTATINVLRYGAARRARVIYHDGTARDLGAPPRSRGSSPGCGDAEARAVRHGRDLLAARGAPPRGDRRHARA